MSTQYNDFIQYLLAKKNSALVSQDDNGALIDLSRYEGSYLAHTTRYEIHADGRVMVYSRDDVEGTDFRQRNRFLLKNLRLDVESSKHHVLQQGW